MIGDPGRPLGGRLVDLAVDTSAALPRFDAERGELVLGEHLDGTVRELIAVRVALVDAALLGAIVAELERRGYTVTPPEATS